MLVTATMIAASITITTHISHTSQTNTDKTQRYTCIQHQHLTFTNKISALPKSCYNHTCELRCICPYLDFKTASTIATCTVRSKLDYCNSLYHNLPNLQINQLQQIQALLLVLLLRPYIHIYHSNSQISPVAYSNWMYSVQNSHLLTYKVLTPVNLASYLHSLIRVQLLIHCHLFLTTNHLLVENHRLLI